jgi:hypothetical protein
MHLLDLLHETGNNILQYKLQTNFLDLNPTAASLTATQVVSNIVWYPKVYFFVNKSLPLLPNLSQINSIHATTPNL